MAFTELEDGVKSVVQAPIGVEERRGRAMKGKVLRGEEGLFGTLNVLLHCGGGGKDGALHIGYPIAFGLNAAINLGCGNDVQLTARCLDRTKGGDLASDCSGHGLVCWRLRNKVRFELTKADWGALSELIEKASGIMAPELMVLIDSRFWKSSVLWAMASGEGDQLLGARAVGRLCLFYRMLELHFMVSGSWAVVTSHAILGIS
ncbi:hypothetical protein Dimus_001818 [Dionaea muscipula]